MKVSTYRNDQLREEKTLWEALRLQNEPHKIISVVGAGGKSSTIDQLAGELAMQGLKVIVTTTTHIFQTDQYPMICTASAQDVANYNWKSRIVVVGSKAEGNKLKGLPPTEALRAYEYADIVLIEADGARRLPLKVPEEHEPCIIPETDVVIGVAGLDSIGTKFAEGCFRWEKAQKVLGKRTDFNRRTGECISEEDVAAILTSEDGTRKSVGGRPYRVVLNKADDSEKEKSAIRVIEKIEEKSGVCCVVTSYRL